MSRRASATMIGAFVMGALALLVAGLLVIGSGRLGGDRETFLLVFRYSTGGLKVGAPVVLKGVQIGVVKDITVAYDEKTGRFEVPVYVEIDQNRVQWPKEIRGELDTQELYDKAMEAGLRARLGLQSLVTGMQQIEVGFFPGTPLVLSDMDTGYRELPTIPSAFDRLWGQVESLPLENLVQRTVEVLDRLNRLVSSEELPRILKNLDTASSELALASGELRADVGPTVAKLDDALGAVGRAADEVQRLAQNLNTEVGPVAKSLRGAGDSTQSAFESFEETVHRFSSAVGERSTLYREVLSTLRAATSAARSLADLADYLERHPEALIRGKR